MEIYNEEFENIYSEVFQRFAARYDYSVCRFFVGGRKRLDLYLDSLTRRYLRMFYHLS